MLIVEAYTLTSLTSIFILNTTAVPAAFVITKMFFKVTYKKNHIIALVLCLLGALMAIIQDTVINPVDRKNPFTSSAFLGDLCTLGSAILYALSNVLQEFLLAKGTSVQVYLSVVGLFGTFITLVEGLAFGEEKTLEGKPFWPVFGLYFGFCAFNFFNYSVIPIFV